MLWELISQSSTDSSASVRMWIDVRWFWPSSIVWTWRRLFWRHWETWHTSQVARSLGLLEQMSHRWAHMCEHTLTCVCATLHWHLLSLCFSFKKKKKRKMNVGTFAGSLRGFWLRTVVNWRGLHLERWQRRWKKGSCSVEHFFFSWTSPQRVD